MTTTAVLNTMFGYEVSDAPANCLDPESIREHAGWNARLFGEEQVRSLVQQLFFQNGLKTPRQIVFSAVDNETPIGEICVQVGHALSAQTSGTVCIAEITSDTGRDRELTEQHTNSNLDRSDWLHDSALQLSKRLWLVPPDVFLGNRKSLSVESLRRDVDKLRLAFDYTIFQAPPAGNRSDALLLGHICDGIVLVFMAGSTRRATARKAMQRLHAAGARLLGTVLAGRKFPIPERIYRRL